ncbi:MAG: sugar ABC transporter permease [Clostridiaceae bacterium]|nr:sugar ABC transporter permease [Clostridiaceae bacterium]
MSGTKSISQSDVKEESLKDSIKAAMKANMRQYTMFIALIFIGIIFNILTDGTFISSRNLNNLFLQTATIAILACGMVLIIIAGHIDLSIGSVAGFCGAIAAIAQVKYGWGTVPAILLTLVVGLIVGLWQGYWVAYQNVPSFIVTLAGMLIFRGAVIGVTNGATIAPMKDSFRAIGQDYIPRLFLQDASYHDTTLFLGIICILAYIIFEARSRRTRVSYGFKVLPFQLQIVKVVAISALIGLTFLIMVSYLGMPYCIVLVAAVVFFYSYLSTMTPFGRHVYAIGGNKEAARLSGINIKRTTLLIFISMGLLSAIGGIVFTGRLNSATASAGNLFELDAIAACYIGGASAMGGEGSVIGAIIGALVMATINNGMSLMNVEIQWQNIVKGLILLAAVWIDIVSRKKSV